MAPSKSDVPRFGIRTPQRACDLCRRRKLRCDGSKIQNGQCSRCATSGLDCTYIEDSNKRAYTLSYVKALEQKVEKLEKLVRQLCPDDLFYSAAMTTLEKKVSSSQEQSAFTSGHTEDLKVNSFAVSRSLALVTSYIRGPTNDTVDEEDEEIALSLSEGVKSLKLMEPSDFRSHGRASGALLVQRIFNARMNKLGTETGAPLLSVKYDLLQEWEKQPFQLTPIRPFNFPEDDLLDDLVALYFEHVNLYLPLFHQPRFERSLAERLHHRNMSFGLLVLLVCAVGSCFSSDLRARLDPDKPHSAGWKWFNQAVSGHKIFSSPTTLYDVQFYPVAVQFIAVTPVPQLCWTLIGTGLRAAMYLGAHRHDNSKILTAEDELKKRAFWVLLVLDRLFGSQNGRPCLVHDEDFDLDLPVDCDDEYWDHENPLARFVQPEGKPSKIASFIALIKLNRILGITIKTIYAPKTTKILLGLVKTSDLEPIVAELDSALNTWLDVLPHHLRWNQDQTDDVSYHQSMMLHVYYYLVQITVHRSFIPTSSTSSPFPFPSFSICTSAARSCVSLLGLTRGKGHMPALLMHGPTLTSALVLILLLWSGKRSPQGFSSKDLEDVQNSIKVVEIYQHQSSLSARVLDVLRRLVDEDGNLFSKIKKTASGDTPNQEPCPHDHGHCRESGQTNRPVAPNDSSIEASLSSKGTLDSDPSTRLVEHLEFQDPNLRSMRFDLSNDLVDATGLLPSLAGSSASNTQTRVGDFDAQSFTPFTQNQPITSVPQATNPSTSFNTYGSTPAATQGLWPQVLDAAGSQSSELDLSWMHPPQNLSNADGNDFDMTDISMWTQSPTAMLFHEFAPYFGSMSEWSDIQTTTAPPSGE